MTFYAVVSALANCMTEVEGPSGSCTRYCYSTVLFMNVNDYGYLSHCTVHAPK